MRCNRILGVIPARGGSKRLPRKNVRMLAGKPLIAWTIEAALKSGVCKRLIVSTDDEEIAKVSKQYGAEVPFLRPSELATDTATSFSVAKHALNQLAPEEFTHILLLQPTSPLRTPEDICAAVGIAQHPELSVVSTCNPPAPNGAIYLIPLETFKKEQTFAPSHVVPYLMPKERSVDIDTIDDFKKAEELLTEQQNSIINKKKK